MVCDLARAAGYRHADIIVARDVVIGVLVGLGEAALARQVRPLLAPCDLVGELLRHVSSSVVRRLLLRL